MYFMDDPLSPDTHKNRTEAAHDELEEEKEAP
jgi:hypothetical protein